MTHNPFNDFLNIIKEHVDQYQIEEIESVQFVFGIGGYVLALISIIAMCVPLCSYIFPSRRRRVYVSPNGSEDDSTVFNDLDNDIFEKRKVIAELERKIIEIRDQLNQGRNRDRLQEEEEQDYDNISRPNDLHQTIQHLTDRLADANESIAIWKQRCEHQKKRADTLENFKSKEGGGVVNNDEKLRLKVIEIENDNVQLLIKMRKLENENKKLLDDMVKLEQQYNSKEESESDLLAKLQEAHKKYKQLKEQNRTLSATRLNNESS